MFYLLSYSAGQLLFLVANSEQSIAVLMTQVLSSIPIACMVMPYGPQGSEAEHFHHDPNHTK